MVDLGMFCSENKRSLGRHCVYGAADWPLTMEMVRGGHRDGSGRT
jgi:hypothetical protein